VIDAIATTSLPVDKQRVAVDVDSIAAGLSDDDDEDYHDEMTSFGSGYYGDYGDTVSAHAHDPVHDVWPPSLPSSSSSSSGFHVDDVDSRLDDKQEQQQTDDVNLKDVSRTLFTTPAAARTRLKAELSPTRRGSLERRRPDTFVTSSSSAARRRYYVENMAANSASFSAFTTTVLFTTVYVLYCVLASFCSAAHVFFRLPVARTSSSPC